MHSILQDIRFGARMLRKNLGFSLAAVITLALGIGGNTAIFTITSALLLKALPYQDPQQLVVLGVQRHDRYVAIGDFTLGRFDLVRDRNRSFASFAVWTNDNLNLTGRGEPQQVPVARVSDQFFGVLGVKPQLGRFFLPEEAKPEGKPAVVISDALWHSRFGGDRNVVGQTLTLDTVPYTVVGVMPAGVQFPFVGPAEIWLPRYFELTLIPAARLRAGVGYLSAVARLRSETSFEQANAEMHVLDQQYRNENPTAPDADPKELTTVGRLQDAMVTDIRSKLLFLSAAVALVLLIACANVASLLLSRALARKKEIAVRTALGASRGTLIRQLLTESVLLALISGVLGLALGFAATKSIAVFGGNNLPQGFPITMDARVLLFTLAVSILTGIVFGLFPALQLAKTKVNETLRSEGQGSTGGHHRVQLRGVLVVGQVALSLLLLIGAGLLVRSFSRLLRVDPGFDPGNVLTMNVSLPTVKYAKPDQQIAFFDEMLRKVSAVPGVRDAAVSAALPLTPRRITPVLPEGQPDVPLAQRQFIIIEAISPAFLHTMRIPLKAGRAFTEADNAQAPKVVIINEALALHYWPHENPVGKHITVGRQTPAEIIGVAANVKNRGLATETQEQLYLPFPQLPWGSMNLMIRSSVDPHSLVSAVRGQISAVDADQPVVGIQTVDELMDGSRAQPRFIMFLLGIFSSVALVLAIIGIYGVLAYSVAQRRKELGIRLALGAEKSDILRLVVGQGMALTLAGVAIGLIAALALSWIMASVLSGMLYKVGARDLTTFAMAPLVFLVIALLASYLPARRATRVDPTEAFRNG